MGDLLARAFTEQALLDAWDEVRDAALQDGVAGAEVEQFEAAAARRISQLAESLADATFSPHPVLRVEIAKQGGGVRRLAVPVLIDRIVERALLAELDAVIDPLLLPWSFAYGGSKGIWLRVGGAGRYRRLLRLHSALGSAAAAPRGGSRSPGR